MNHQSRARIWVRTWSWLPLAAFALGAVPVGAADHNNLDAHRPLSFEDADPVAFREQALEMGLSLGWSRRRPLGLGLDAEYQYGFQMNSHLSLGFEPSIGGRAGSADTRFDTGDVSLGLFHNFNRQHGSVPALALRGDIVAPAGRESRGVGFRLRGIATRQAGQFGRLHLNVDLNANPGAGPGERELHPGLVVGFSHPLGYPTSFTTTGLAEFSARAGDRKGAGPILGIGIGIRKQVGFRSVFDLGIQSDVAVFSGASRDRLRVVTGYTYGF